MGAFQVAIVCVGLTFSTAGCSRASDPKPTTHAVDPSCDVIPEGVENLQPVLEPLRQELHLPALAAAIVSPDKLLASGVVGVRSTASATRACEHDPFHLGSDSKAITALVLAKLIEQQKLSWQTRIRDVFSDTKDQNPAYADVTLEQLLAHRAGLAHDPVSFSLSDMRKLTGSLTQQRAVYVARALSEPPEHTPGTTYAYSNTGYVIAGAMAERVAQRAWEDLVRELVFQPLDMQGAGFGATADDKQLDGPWPHQMANGKAEPMPSAIMDNPLLMAPAASIHAPIESWARFIVDELAGLEGHGQLLTAASYQALFTPSFGGDYARGWECVYRSQMGGYAYMHGGSNTMNYALAWLLPKRRLAVLVATNVGGGKTFDACDKVVSRLLANR